MKNEPPKIKKKDVLCKPMAVKMRGKLVERCGFCSIQPATSYKDALMVGNGSITMYVYGQPQKETVIFNEETLFEPIWKNDPYPPKIADTIPELRQLLINGQYGEASEKLMKSVVRDPYYNNLTNGGKDMLFGWKDHMAFRTQINFINTDSNITDYLRDVNFTTGEATVRFMDKNGEHVRKAFASRVDFVACQKYCAPTDRNLDMDIEILTDAVQLSHPWDGFSAAKDITYIKDYSPELLLITGKYHQNFGNKAYSIAIRVINKGGTVELVDGVLQVRSAKELILMTKIETFDDYSDIKVKGLVEQLMSLTDDYDVLLERNAKVLSALMGRSKIALCSDEEALLATEELMKRQHTTSTVHPALLEKLYNMGRFYLICDSGQYPPAHGQYNINVNLQVCSGNITDLPEMMDIFFGFFESKFEDFKLNAKNVFGCKGIVASIHPTINSGYMYHFSGDYPHIFWISCAGWVFNEFWGHYLVTGDVDFLKNRVLPGLKEIALFYEDFLKDTDENGNYIFYPSFSPENGQLAGYPITINAVMDIMVCREVLENLIEATRVLNHNEPKIEKWEEILVKLPEYLLDEEGALREWAWDSIKDDLDHRHVSHHYDVWPAFEVTWEDTPELAEAILLSNRKRGTENASAHGLMHRLFTAIRLKDKIGTFLQLKEILEHGFINYSLMTNHYPHRVYFQDVIGSMPAALAEMIVYSRPGEIELLPVTSAIVSKGKILGLCLFTFAKLEKMEWDLSAGVIKAEIHSLKEQTISLRYRYGIIKAFIDGREIEVDQKKIEFVKVVFNKEQRITIEIWVKEVINHEIMV